MAMLAKPATRDGVGGYILKSSKMWITNSPIADVFVVWGKISAAGDDHHAIDAGLCLACCPIQ
jgi:alkylation response protein AidB-like acyl-CoA dehydrogenase